MNAKREEDQGKAMTKAAVEAGVKQYVLCPSKRLVSKSSTPTIFYSIVFTSTERGGQAESDYSPTSIPHFRSKYHVEQDIKEWSRSSLELTFNFLRPVAFFENFTNNFFGRGLVAMWRLNGLDRNLHMVSTKDIGLVAADAFINADSDEYRNKAISLAGDEPSPNEVARVFKEVTGQELPYTYLVVGRLLRRMLKEQLGMMFDWFVTDGFKVDVKALRQRYPFVKDLRAWLAQESAWKKA